MTAQESAPPPDLRVIGEELLAEAFIEGVWRLAAVGWATVDLERAADEFEGRWPALRFIDADQSDRLLGAHLRVARADVQLKGLEAIALVLLEPSTEGRVAASLARFGEGPTAVWIAPELAVGDRVEPRTSVPFDGPFGSERLVLGGPISGPHVLLLDGSPGTIDR
jgi:hypothetical protein